MKNGYINISEEQRNRNRTPCDDCCVGWGSSTSYIDVNGDLWVKNEDCHDTCQLYLDFTNNISNEEHEKLLSESLSKYKNLWEELAKT